MFHSNSHTQIVYVEAIHNTELIIYFTNAIVTFNRVSAEGSCICGVHNNYGFLGNNTGFVHFVMEKIIVNNCHRSSKGEIGQVSALKFVNILGVHITDGYFSNNAGTAIDCYNSNLGLKAMNTFINNTAFSGGGISLRALSYLLLASSVQIEFINNTAVAYGGAIYSEFTSLNGCFFLEPNCKEQILHL